MSSSSNLYTLLAVPRAFHRGTTNFWDEPYISEQLLKAHLDPDFEGASRNPGFIADSVEWITHIAAPSMYSDLLDIGCGPGLYAEKLFDRGYRVTGIDFSRRSIGYATEHAKETNRSITYHYGNYLAMNFHEAFDLAIMIYCDYGALSPEEGAVLLSLIYQSLRSGGKLLLDVFTLSKLDLFRERRIWEHHDSGGFWRPDAHFTLQADCLFGNHSTLEQTVVVSPHDVESYYIWQRYFTPETLFAELLHAGFRDPVPYGDVTGKPWSEGLETMAVVVEKP